MTSAAHPRVTTRVTTHLVGPTTWTEVAASLVYDPADPFAVRIRFGGRHARPEVEERRSRHPAAGGARTSGGAEDEGVEWLVARELLQAGLSRPSGDGDIRLWPARTASDVLFLELRAPSGHALFELSRSVLAGFLDETERVVRSGDEGAVLDVDPELLALLQGEGTDPSAP